MFGQSKRKTIIIILSVVAFLLLLYWKWPHRLSHYFENNDPPIGATIFLDDAKSFKQVDLKDNDAITQLYNEVQKTRVRHLNAYKIIYLDNNDLYYVHLYNLSDNEGKWQRICSFECDEDGYVYMNGWKYDVVESSELIPILEQIFEESDAKLVTN